MSDDAPDKVPFPDVEPKTNEAGKVTGARYFLHRNGRAYRDDGMLVQPFPRHRTLYVKMNGGDVTRSLPAAMAAAFATRAEPEPDEGGTWVAITHPDAPDDPETGLPSCAVEYICWTPNSESCMWSRQDKPPTTLLPILL